MVGELDGDEWSAILCLSWGTYHQSCGHWSEAEKWLQGAAAGFQQEGKHHVAVVAMFNLVLLYLSRGDAKAKTLLNLLSKLESSESHHAAIKALEGTLTHLEGEVQGTKASLLACIRACDVTMTNQLKVLSLCILGKVFEATDQAKADMILGTAYGLAKKTKVDGWVFIASDALAKISNKEEYLVAAHKSKAAWKEKLSR